MEQPWPIPVLDGGGVRLRPHTMDDLAPVLERCLDAGTVRWTTVPVDYTEAMARDYLAQIITPMPGRISWAIERAGEYVGTLDLRGNEGSAQPASGDIGFVTHRPGAGAES